MGIKTIQIRTCDAPRCHVTDRKIHDDEAHIDTWRYTGGSIYHVLCFAELSGTDLIRELGLDALYRVSPGGASKRIYDDPDWKRP